MNERQSDFQWLQQFSRAGNQNAFRDLVRRHIDLVFATAMHKVGDAGGAEEISQNVFGALARKAWQFAPDDSLPAWLHKTTLLESKSWLRGELRRRRREEAAAELGTTMKTPDDQPAFNALVPLLDDALLSLREKDRTALLLRFYEKQSLREVGAAMNVGEDAAQKRVQSALENLSQFFQRHGYRTATAAAAAAALQHTMTSVSAATATTVASVVLKSAPPALVGLGAWLSRLASLSKVQTAAVCLLIAVAPVVWKLEKNRELKVAAETLQEKISAIKDESAQLSSELEALRKTSARLEQNQNQIVQVQARVEDAQRKLAGLKQRSRAMLVADDYRWPEDLPFVRVPKSALASIEIDGGSNTPDTVATKINQFLDLTAQEREVIGQIFTNYFEGIDRMMAASLYETNRSLTMTSPSGAESKVFVLLPMGEKIRTALKQLASDLERVLGSERWAMVKPNDFEFSHDEQNRLLGYTTFAWDNQQEIMVNIFNPPGGEPMVSWAGSDGTGGSPRPLSSKSLISSFIFPQGPPALIERVKQSILAEAKARQPNSK